MIVMKKFGKGAKALCVATVISMTATGCTTGTESTVNKNEEASVSENASAVITLADDEITVSGSGVSVDDNIATITSGGEYTVTGSISDGQIIVDADSDVNLIMDNADITYDAGDAIYIKDGDVTITLAEESENSVTSGNESSEKLADTDDSSEDETEADDTQKEDTGEDDAEEEDSQTEEEKEQQEAMSAAIFSKDDLIIEGSGSLNVTSYYNNGIQSKDTVTINSGDITVTAVNDGIKGKEGVAVSGGTIDITSEGDGIQSNMDMDISDGEINIVSGGGSGNASSASTQMPAAGEEPETDENGNPDMSNMTPPDGAEMETDENGNPDMSGMTPPDGAEMEMETDENGNPDMSGMTLPDGEEMETDENGRPDRSSMKRQRDEEQETDENGTASVETKDFRGQMFSNDASASEDEDTSGKGIKAEGILSVSGGTININSSDDAIHSNDQIGIDGGEFTLNAGDDGIHADNSLIINAGGIKVESCVEGFEAVNIEINDGEIDITATDDGVNANGGNSGFGQGQFIREATTEAEDATEADTEETSDTEEENPLLTINGGTININSEGDGLDSNKDMYINGGEITVAGPTNGGNSAIDYGSDTGGVCVITAGTVVATGYSDMAEMFDSDESKQNSLVYVFDSDVAAETQITITDSEGNEICSYTTLKKCDCITYSSELLKSGETYTITAGSQTGTIELTTMSVSNKELTGFGGGGGFGGRGGFGNTTEQ